MRTGGGRGRGVTALFAGDSGTGKTMSAEVIAGELGLDLYTSNLATVVDKYVGETEKNLERIFAEAGGVNAVLLFDEADAIFGKRSEVRDAHDRYANIESAYLLQRMETFDGLAVLATNLRANIDEAFTRRLDVIIDFPAPDAGLRGWRCGSAASAPPLPLRRRPRPGLLRRGRSSWPAATSAPPRPPPPTSRPPTAAPIGMPHVDHRRSSRSTASSAGWCWSASSAATSRCSVRSRVRPVPYQQIRISRSTDALLHHRDRCGEQR